LKNSKKKTYFKSKNCNESNKNMNKNMNKNSESVKYITIFKMTIELGPHIPK